MKLKRIKRLPNLYCLLWTPTGTSHALHVRKMYVGKLLLTNKINVPHIKVKLFFFLKKKKTPHPMLCSCPEKFCKSVGFFFFDCIFLCSHYKLYSSLSKFKLVIIYTKSSAYCFWHCCFLVISTYVYCPALLWIMFCSAFVLK